MSQSDRTLERLSFPIQYLEIGESLLRRQGREAVALYERVGVENADALQMGQTINGLQFRRALQLFLNMCEPEPAPLLQILDHFPLTIHGPLGLLAIASPTLGDALEAALQHAPLIMPAFNIRREKHGPNVHLVFERRFDFAPVNEIFTELVMGTFIKIQPFLTRLPDFIELQFAHAPLGAETDYAMDLPVRFVFEASRNQLVARARDLAIPLVAPSRSSRALMQASLEQLRRQSPDQQPTIQQVRRLLQQALQVGQPLEAVQIAESLKVSIRTLSRRLQSEGATLPQLQAEVGVAFAEWLLLETDRAIAEVATAAGFQDATSFARAFKRLRGVTPSGFRSGDASTAP
jgi:AraC-like DNA-binding protein